MRGNYQIAEIRDYKKGVINYDQPKDFTKRTELKKTDKLKRKYKSVDEILNNYTLDYYDYNKDFENIKDYKYNQNIVDGFSNLKY